jgi:hypothetical protein
MGGMSEVLPIIQGGASILKGFGGIMAGAGARSAGKAEQRAAEFQAQQLEQNAGQAVAASQRVAEEERRKAQLVASRALAVAAASGGGASDVSVQNIIAEIQGEGTYRAMTALYEGEERARQLRMGAAGKRFEGDIAAKSGRQKQMAYTIGGLGEMGIGGASLYMKYGRGGASTPNAPSGDGALITDSFDTGNLA